MTTNFPTSVDSFPDPLATDRLDNPPHDVLHTNVNSAVEALQAKVGADSSAVTTSHDYKITQLEGKSPTITLAGDASGSVTLTNLGSGTLTVTVADDSHSHSYLPLTGGTLTGNTTYSQTGRYITLGAWSSDGNWAAVQGANGYLLLDGNYADDDVYLRSANNSGRINIGAGNNNTLQVDNGSATLNGNLDVTGNLDTGSSIHFGQHTLTSPYQYRSVLIPDSYTSYGISFGEYYARPTVASYTTSQPLYLVGGGSVQIGVHSNNRIGYFNTAGLYLEQGWLRTYGQTGWYSESYGGGLYMTDTTWLRSYNAKHVYTNGGFLRAYHGAGATSWSSVSLQGQSSANSGIGFQSYASNSHTGQLRPASGIWYVRNYADSAYWTIAAYISNQSSRRFKQDIETWGVAKPLSSAVNATYDTTATDLVKQLRPVSYRLKKHERLVRHIPKERRREALERLNIHRMKNDLEQYDGEEAVHECGRDCDGTPEQPCAMYANWNRGTLGFIAEEVGEVIPEATDMELKPDSHHIGENTAIDGLALTAVLTKAIQEIEARLSALESV